MQREKPSLIHRRLSLIVFQGHPGGINYKSNLSRYVNPFDVSLVKILHILRYWSGKTPSIVTSHMLCESLRHFSLVLPHRKSPQAPDSNLLKHLHLFSCSIQFKAQETLNQPMHGVFVLANVSVSKQSTWCIHTHFHAHVHALALYVPTPQTHLGGRAWNGCRPAHSRKTCLKQSVLSSEPLLTLMLSKTPHTSRPLSGARPFFYALSAVHLF